MDLAQKLKEFQADINHAITDKNSKVLLVDGMNHYIRVFSSNPTMNDHGEHMGGVVGFLKSIGSIIRQFKPSRVVIVFDGKGGSMRRRKIYSDYKANRKTNIRLNRTYDFATIDEEKDSQKKQLLLLVELLRALPVSIISVDNIEADDAIAYLATLIKERGGNCIITSTDKDFLQLIDANISVYNPIKKKMYHVKEVIEDYKIHPSNFQIYRILDGDTSDNINGVSGFGLKTLLKYFPELQTQENVSWNYIFEIAKTSKSKVCKRLLESTDIIDRNKELMRLDVQQMSGMTGVKILDIFETPVNPLDKLTIIQLLTQHKITKAFDNVSTWLISTFGSLTRFS